MKTSDIVTSQYVSITQTPAGVGERVLARLIDMVILFIYLVTLYRLGPWDWVIHVYDGVVSYIIYVLLQLPAIFYSPLCEYFMDGQTLGKRIMRTRVVMVDGAAPTLGAILLRWVFMVVDVYFSCLGIIFIICTRRNQRLGDLAAGTMVIRAPRKEQMHLSLDEFYYASPDYTPVYPEVQQLSLGQADVISRMLNDRKVYSDEQVHRLVQKVEQLLDIRHHEPSDTAFLQTILHDYQYYALQVI